MNALYDSDSGNTAGTVKKHAFFAGIYNLVYIFLAVLTTTTAPTTALSQNNQDYDFEIVRVNRKVDMKNINPSLGILYDKPYSLFYLGDMKDNSAYVNPKTSNLGISLTLFDIGFTFSSSLLSKNSFDDNISYSDINICYTNNTFMNIVSYKEYKSYNYFKEDKPVYVDYNLKYSSFSESFYFKLLGDVSLKNIYLRNENQNRTKAGLFGKIVLDHHVIKSRDEILPSDASSRFDSIKNLSGISALTAAPMISAIVNFRILSDNLTLGLGASAGPNIINNYDIVGGPFVKKLSLSPKADFFASTNIITKHYYFSVMSAVDIYTTVIDEKNSLYQVNFSSKIFSGVRF